MTYYGHKWLGLFYRRSFGVDHDGIEIRGRRFAWQEVAELRGRNLVAGALLASLLGQPKASILLNNGERIDIYANEFVEEGKKRKRTFVTGVSSTFDELSQFISARSGKRWA